MSHLSDLICWYHVDIIISQLIHSYVHHIKNIAQYPLSPMSHMLFKNIYRYIYISIIFSFSNVSTYISIIGMSSHPSFSISWWNHSKGPSYSLYNDYNGSLWLMIMNMMCTIMSTPHYSIMAVYEPIFRSHLEVSIQSWGYPKLAGWNNFHGKSDKMDDFRVPPRLGKPSSVATFYHSKRL